MKPPPPYDLRCEYLNNPLGVDVARPRLSWILKHPQRSQRQKAYRIVISSSFDLSARSDGDLWDSRRVDSSATTHIAYDGTPLQSGQTCYWRIQWWDNEERLSDFSEVATFELGLLHVSDWKGKSQRVLNADKVGSRITMELRTHTSVIFLPTIIFSRSCFMVSTSGSSGISYP